MKNPIGTHFGYPVAHEDDPERAIRAGLAAIEAVRGLQTPGSLHVRIGLATGLAVVGDLIGSGAAEERSRRPISLRGCKRSPNRTRS